MKTFIQACLIIVSLPLISACSELTTETPFGTSTGIQTDTRLFGGWKMVPVDAEDTETSYVFFQPREEGGLYGIYIGWGDPRRIEDPDEHGWLSFEGFTGRAGDYNFINVRTLLQNGQPFTAPELGYYPWMYRLETTGDIQFFSHDEDLIEEAVAQGRIAANVMGGEYTTDIHITADAQSLDVFFAEEAPAIFTKPVGILQRLD